MLGVFVYRINCTLRHTVGKGYRVRPGEGRTQVAYYLMVWWDT